MKNNLRALFGISALAFGLTALPVLAAQVDVTAQNDTTGFNSDNNNKTSIDNSGDVTLHNDGHVDNNAHVNANTGDNDQTKNTGTTGAGDPTTGTISGSTDWNNVVNMGSSLCGCQDSDWSVTADFLNHKTGADSDNNNSLVVDNGGDFKLSNVADVMNSLNVKANTGDNDQTKNTTVGDITTGDVNVDSMISNMANSSDNSGSHSAGQGSVDATFENNLTGADSDNTNRLTIKNDGDTKITNRAHLDNSIRVDANTGKNDQTKNTKAGDINTGSVNVTADIQNVANNNTGCACANTGHSTDVTVNAGNNTTGADSDNKNTVTVKNNSDTTIKNDAHVDNDLNVKANTGDNSQKENTMAGEVKTGDVNFDFTVSNNVNSSN